MVNPWSKKRKFNGKIFERFAVGIPTKTEANRIAELAKNVGFGGHKARVVRLKSEYQVYYKIKIIKKNR